jgi:hypothetical protein
MAPPYANMIVIILLAYLVQLDSTQPHPTACNKCQCLDSQEAVPATDFISALDTWHGGCIKTLAGPLLLYSGQLFDSF